MRTSRTEPTGLVIGFHDEVIVGEDRPPCPEPEPRVDLGPRKASIVSRRSVQRAFSGATRGPPPMIPRTFGKLVIGTTSAASPSLI